MTLFWANDVYLYPDENFAIKISLLWYYALIYILKYRYELFSLSEDINIVHTIRRITLYFDFLHSCLVCAQLQTKRSVGCNAVITFVLIIDYNVENFFSTRKIYPAIEVELHELFAYLESI